MVRSETVPGAQAQIAFGRGGFLTPDGTAIRLRSVALDSPLKGRV